VDGVERVICVVSFKRIEGIGDALASKGGIPWPHLHNLTDIRLAAYCHSQTRTPFGTMQNIHPLVLDWHHRNILQLLLRCLADSHHRMMLSGKRMPRTDNACIDSFLPPYNLTNSRRHPSRKRRHTAHFLPWSRPRICVRVGFDVELYREYIATLMSQLRFLRFSLSRFYVCTYACTYVCTLPATRDMYVRMHTNYVRPSLPLSLSLSLPPSHPLSVWCACLYVSMCLQSI